MDKIIRFNDDSETDVNKIAYVPRIFYNEHTHKRQFRVDKISGDLSTWKGDKFPTEAEAYIALELFVLYQQKIEMNELLTEALSKGIEAFPSLNDLFKQRHPGLADELSKNLSNAVQEFLKSREEN